MIYETFILWHFFVTPCIIRFCWFFSL